MNRIRAGIGVATLSVAALVLLSGADASRVEQDRIGRLRNLGKAFYENPTTLPQAVNEFKKALDVAPNSAREHVNYGLALLRAGKTKEGVAELERAQKLDPTIPHTWFNLGIAFKKEGEYAPAVAQFEGLLRLVPDEPVSHYNLGVLHKLAEKRGEAVREFETAERLNPNLAAPHFQLYNLYRQAGRAADAARELEIFQKLKALTEGAVIPEDMEWSYYAEIYDPIPVRPESEPAPPPKFEDRKVAAGTDAGFDAATAGLLVLDAFGDRRPDVLAWSSNGAQLYRNGTALVADSGLAGIKNIVSVAAGDYDNDGLPDLCIITSDGPALYHNNKGKFEKSPLKLPAGRFSKAVWIDFDHDYDLDLILLGEDAALARNNGEAGFSDDTAAFPFVKGAAIDAAAIDLIADTNGVDLAVSYRDHTGVLYRDRLLGRYEATPLDTLPAGAKGLTAFDVNNDSWTDLAADGLLLLNHQGKLEPFPDLQAKGPLTFADLDNRGIGDMLAGNGVYRNLGLDHFEKTPTGIPAAVAAVASDFDGDGRADVALIAGDGSLHLLRNVTETHNHWLLAGLNGVKNMKLAPGAKVEIKTGSSYQKRTYQRRAAAVRRGFLQDRRCGAHHLAQRPDPERSEQPVNKAIEYQEAQRLSGSCPMIFTWDGGKFRFITDVLGVAPLGAASGDGSYFPVDHDEYVQIPGEALQAVNGRYEIRITEELREVSYLDQVKLMAVDHPASVEIFTNDKFKSPPFPEFRLFGVKRRIYPVRARDDRGPRRATAPAAPRPHVSGWLPARLSGCGRTASPGSGFRQSRAGQPRRADPERLGGLGRWQHLHGRLAGEEGSGAALSAGEGRRRTVEDRDRRYGHPGGQAQDDFGGSHRQVSIGLARSAHRHQPLRVLGRDLPERRERRAARAADRYPGGIGGPAFPRLLHAGDSSAAQAARGLRLRAVDAGLDVESDPGTSIRATATCCR